VQRASVLPSIGRNGATAVASKVNDDGIAGLDGGIVDEVGHERIFDGTFRSLAVKQHAYMVARDVEIVHEPALHFERVIDTGR
jgi:predicted fused transcriptional regulator/phosphomethylpyrimidine kinase